MKILSILVAVLLSLCMGCDRSSSKTAKAPVPPSPRTQPSTAPITDRQVEARVVQIVAEQMGVPVSQVGRNTRLVADLKADELDLVELVMELEDTFTLSIPDEDAEEFRTVGQMSDYVRAKRKP
jgi:acyl carrier protein